MKRLNTAIMAVAMVLGGGVAAAQTELEAALSGGGELLEADQIAALLIGHRVKATSGEKTFNFYYKADNVLTGELTNGGWKGEGAFAITDTDQVCVSMAADKGRYRCLTVLRVGDVVQKFNSEGKKTFELSSFEPAEGL